MAFQVVDTVRDPLGAAAEARGTAMLLGERGISAQVVSPWALSEKTGSDGPTFPVVVGGGEIVNAPGDPYSDAYRILGGHVLNAAGVTTQLGLEYLKDYEYVSVRSTRDLRAVEAVVGKAKAHVVPPTSMAIAPEDFKDIEVGSQFPKDVRPHGDGATRSEKVQKRPVVVSLTADMAAQVPSLFRVLAEIDEGGVVFCPMHHTLDRVLLHLRIGAEMGRIPEVRVFGRLGAAVQFVAGASLVVSASYLAVVWAYRFGVPFLGWGKDPAIEAFLADRGLEKWAFFQARELEDKLALAQSGFEDTSSLVKDDLQKLGAHADRMAEVLAEAVHESPWASEVCADSANRAGSGSEGSQEGSAKLGDFSEPGSVFLALQAGGPLEGIPEEILAAETRVVADRAVQEARVLAQRSADFAEAARFWRQVAERHKARGDAAIAGVA